jgi:hypothetical protein
MAGDCNSLFRSLGIGLLPENVSRHSVLSYLIADAEVVKFVSTIPKSAEIQRALTLVSYYKAKGNRELELNVTQKLLGCVDDANILGENINVIKRNTADRLDVNKDIGREVGAEKTKYMLVSRHRTTGQINRS